MRFVLLKTANIKAITYGRVRIEFLGASFDLLEKFPNYVKIFKKLGFKPEN